METIHDICKKYNIKNYTVNGDGSIDVNGNVNLSGRELTEFPLIFNKVMGDFHCGMNNLTSLKGCPRWIGGNFSCSNNRLSSLEFSPEYVGGYFECIDNDLIDNYCDTEIGGYFYTTLVQDGMIFDYNEVTNYNEWRKLYKRKKILDDIFNM
jgi:hypothetical protein